MEDYKISYKTIGYQTRPNKTIVDHMRRYEIIQYYRRPYKTFQNHTSLYKMIEGSTKSHNIKQS